MEEEGSRSGVEPSGASQPEASLQEAVVAAGDAPVTIGVEVARFTLIHIRSWCMRCALFAGACSVVGGFVASASAQNPGLRDIAPNTAVDLGRYDCTGFEALGEHAEPGCRTITDYGGMVFDPTGYRTLVWGGGHAATYRDDVEVFDLATLQWAPDAPPTPCEEMTLDNVDMVRARWTTSNHPISRHAYDLLVVVPPRRELWMLARMQGRGRGCNRLPPVDADAGSPYVIAQGRMAAYDFEERTWRYTDAESVNFGTGAEYDPVSGRVLLVSAQKIRWLDPETGTIEPLATIDEPDMDTGRGVTLVYHAGLDRFYAIVTVPRRPEAGGIWEVALQRDEGSVSIRELSVSLPTSPAPARDAWAYDEVDDLIVGGVTDGTVFGFDPRSGNWYAQTAIVDSSEGIEIGTVLSKTLVYDTVDGVIVFRARADGAPEHTWAYRWDAEAPPIPPAMDAGVPPSLDGGAGSDGGGRSSDGGSAGGGGAGSDGGPGRMLEGAPAGCACGIGGRDAPWGDLVSLLLACSWVLGRRTSRNRRGAPRRGI